ncbi:hypothetical protein [Nostoc sp.]|uniref:hypothetical protein n=1 Tax=Nostoc sp. TaxID=1180 RepID=UPI002FFB04D3
MVIGFPVASIYQRVAAFVDLVNNLIAGKREHSLGTPQKWVNAVPVTLLELVYPSAALS